MISFFSKHSRKISLALLFCFLTELSGNVAFALTSGPSQPETQQFSPASMDNMVDPFTGDFSYNIPLMDVGGYPVNINYASGVTPDAEASWVGLGWNLNVGAMNRSVRGLPDDFAGDAVVRDFNVKPNQTYGAGTNVNFGFIGFKLGKVVPGLDLSATFQYNNYNGFSMTSGVGLKASMGAQAGGGNKDGLTGNLGVNMSVGSESGVEVTPSFGLKSKQTSGNNESTLNASISLPYSTREGLKGMTLSGGYSHKMSRTDGPAGNQTTTGAQGGTSSHAFMGFSTPTYTPTLENDMYNVNVSTNFSFGLSTPATEYDFGFSGFYSGQFLKDTRKSSPAFGYMYSGLSQSENKLMDFNREKDGSYNQFTTNLALTNFTYDIFQANSQGGGGTYRLYRGDVGTVHDAAVINQGYSPTLGASVDIGVSPSTLVGIDVDFNYSQSKSGKWSDERDDINKFRDPKNSSVNKPGTEVAYFKKMGDVTPEQDMNFLNNVQHKYDVVRHQLKQSSSYFGDGRTNGNYILANQSGESSAQVNAGANTRNQRNTRTSQFTTLTAGEAEKGAILPIQNYAMNDFTWQYKSQTNRTATASNVTKGYKYTELSRTRDGKKPHHISESRITDESGNRYIYGIPAYNTLQEEVTFAVANGSGDRNTGMTTYKKDNNDSKNNQDGFDHFYNKVSTPGFAHSYLLTCILSSDYVDRDNIPGPSDGDLGTYTKFNYTRAIEKYKWRTPFSETEGMASFSEGMLTAAKEDDKGNYIYGEKEIWYLHSIETKTHVAEFYLKDRQDGRGTLTQHGGVGNEVQQCLDKIVLYSKPDKWNSQGEPIKVVHFDYDYSLCPGTPNSVPLKNASGTVIGNANKGKLTLKKVWFTYGKSQKGVLNPYVFQYAQNAAGQYDATLNPGYSFKNYDRWGNYKPDGTDGRRNAEFPYSDQNKSRADHNAAVYALSSIQTPTGGTLRVLYESDDYAYVQNKQAMRMFNVLGATSSATDNSAGTNKLYDSSPNERQYLIVDLGEGFTPDDASNANNEFRKKYLDGVDLMYYKFKIRVVNTGAHTWDEYVPGYAEINKDLSQLSDRNSVTGTDGKKTYKTAVIKLNSVSGTGKGGGPMVNPIVRNGWMYGRLNLNRELMGNAGPSDSGLKQVISAIISQAGNLVSLFMGFVNTMTAKGNSSMFFPSDSFVRMNEPDKIKIGGGHRVKALIMADNWGLMRSTKEQLANSADKQTAYYGQAYDYTCNENGKQISAGVAAYEPALGGEENPFHRPVFVREKTPLAPAKEYYLEEPFGESFFPAATVGYKRVTVLPLKITGPLSNTMVFQGNGTGRVVHEFYTAQDFPSITKRTGLQTYRHKPNMLLKFMKFDCKDLVTCTQGYYVELNDMHGKQKAQRVYPESKSNSGGLLSFLEISAMTPISEVEYRYKVNADGTLNNKVTYIDKDLKVIPENDPSAPEMGVDMDMVQDERYSESSTVGGGVHVDLKWIQIAILPIFLPPVYPQINHEETRFRSLVTTKVVNKYGVLESTTAKDNGAAITTNNLAWDRLTGKVLLTKVENEFHDPLYNFSYPGHMVYERFKPASANEGLIFDGTGNGYPVLKNTTLKDGDEIYVESGDAEKIVYFTGNKLVKKSGQDFTASFTKAKIIRSGARNTTTTPVGSVSTIDNPIRSGSPYLVFTKVLNAGATEFKDDWKRFCNCPEYENSPAKSINPYVLGLKGNMRALRSWTYLTERTQSNTNNDLNIRKDGYLSDYTSFWNYSGDRLVPPVNPAQTKWQYVSVITNYNPAGMEIENLDALNRFSTAQFGYSRNLPVATSNNSQYKDSGFDSFEDYGYEDCEDDHLSWRQYSNKLSPNQAHTGKNSIRLSTNERLMIRKVITPCPSPSPY